MRKSPLRLSLCIGVIVVGLVAGFVLDKTIWAGHHNATSPIVHATPTAQRATVTIPEAQDRFVPFILVIQLHTIVTWQNNDRVAHVFTTTPDQSSFLNPQPFSLKIAVGQSAQFTFTQAGLYHYYETTMSTWNRSLSHVAARVGVPQYPLAMDGMIWVQGPITGLPSVAVNQIPKEHAAFATEFLAIAQSGVVTWHNFGEYPHFIGLVPSWPAPINPADIGLHRLAGTEDVPGGEAVTISFNTPGLYYYYCRNHDRIDATTHRVQSLKKASDYPIPMEGFVLVVGS